MSNVRSKGQSIQTETREHKASVGISKTKGELLDSLTLLIILREVSYFGKISILSKKIK